MEDQEFAELHLALMESGREQERITLCRDRLLNEARERSKAASRNHIERQAEILKWLARYRKETLLTVAKSVSFEKFVHHSGIAVKGNRTLLRIEVNGDVWSYVGDGSWTVIGNVYSGYYGTYIFD